jgi:hypothetical protein
VIAEPSLAMSYLLVFLGAALAADTPIGADWWPVLGTLGVVVSLFAWVPLGAACSRRNLAAGFLLANALALGWHVVSGDTWPIVVATLTSPSWMLQVRLAQDQGTDRDGETGRGRATVILLTGLYMTVIGVLQAYAMMTANLTLVLAIHGAQCLAGAIVLRFVVPGEAAGRKTSKLTWALWVDQLRTWRDADVRVAYYLFGLSAGTLSVTELHIVRHMERDLGIPHAWAILVFTISAAVGVLAAIKMDVICARYPRLSLTLGGLLLVITFVIAHLGELGGVEDLQIAGSYAAGTLSQVVNTMLGTWFSLRLALKVDRLSDARQSMGHIVRFTCKALVLVVGMPVGAFAVAVAASPAAGYTGELWLGLGLAVVFALVAYCSWTLRYGPPEPKVRGRITGLMLRHDRNGDLVVDVEAIDAETKRTTSTPVPVGRGGLTVGGDAIRIWETPDPWWRRRSTPDAPMVERHPITPSGTQRFRLAEGRTVWLRIAGDVVLRQDRSVRGKVRLFAGTTTSRRALTDACLSAAAPGRAARA